MQQQSRTEDGWCLLLVKPGKEQAARNSFCRHGLMAYWPNYEVSTRWSPINRLPSSVKRRSVIPGYLFVEGPPGETFWKVVQRVEDIVNIVRMHSGQIGMLRQRDIDAIVAIEEELNKYEPGKSMHNFKTGDRVRFRDPGSLPPGLVSRSTGDGRLVIEVEMMGRMVPMHVFPHQIEKA